MRGEKTASQIKWDYSSYVFFPKYFRFEDLRVKLKLEGYSNISYIIVNGPGADARSQYLYLKKHVSDHISVYQQEQHQPDIWSRLKGNKDDILIYDRYVSISFQIKIPILYLFTFIIYIVFFIVKCNAIFTSHLI